MGKILIAKKFYDIDKTYDRYDFLKAQFYKKTEEIKIINKSLYGRW